MKRGDPISLLSLVLAFSSVFSVQTTAMWHCEGQKCGITLWYCCCYDPQGPRDANCGNRLPERAATTGCPASCNCEMVTISAPASLASLVSAPDASDHAVAPARSEEPGATACKLLSHGFETRGPPLMSRLSSPPGLRAPPLA